MMVGDWRKIEHGLFESADGQWRITNPWKLSTELRTAGSSRSGGPAGGAGTCTTATTPPCTTPARTSRA